MHGTFSYIVEHRRYDFCLYRLILGFIYLIASSLLPAENYITLNNEGQIENEIT